MTVTKTAVLVLDCSEPLALAEFYADLLGAEIQEVSDPDLVEVVGQTGVHVAIRRDNGYAPASWPRPEDSQQAHLCIVVEPGDLDEAEREAVSLGARPVHIEDPGGRRDVRVFTDPAGHSFSFMTARPDRPSGPRAQRSATPAAER